MLKQVYYIAEGQVEYCIPQILNSKYCLEKVMVRALSNSVGVQTFTGEQNFNIK